jgi:hypothetical protein
METIHVSHYKKRGKSLCFQKHIIKRKKKPMKNVKGKRMVTYNLASYIVGLPTLVLGFPTHGRGGEGCQ